MKTLKEIKNDIASEWGHEDTKNVNIWDSFLNEIQGDADLINNYIGYVAILYAEQAIEIAIRLIEAKSWSEESEVKETSYILSSLIDEIENIKTQLK